MITRIIKILYCSNVIKKLRPQMTIYGIPLFDYKVWLLLMVVSGMVFVMLRMKDHN